MISKLEFNLPEEMDEFTFALHGSKYWGALGDFTELLNRRIRKEDLSDEVLEALEKLQEEIYAIMEDRGVNLNEVS